MEPTAPRATAPTTADRLVRRDLLLLRLEADRRRRRRRRAAGVRGRQRPTRSTR